MYNHVYIFHHNLTIHSGSEHFIWGWISYKIIKLSRYMYLFKSSLCADKLPQYAASSAKFSSGKHKQIVFHTQKCPSSKAGEVHICTESYRETWVSQGMWVQTQYYAMVLDVSFWLPVPLRVVWEPQAHKHTADIAHILSVF